LPADFRLTTGRGALVVRDPVRERTRRKYAGTPGNRSPAPIADCRLSIAARS